LRTEKHALRLLFELLQELIGNSAKMPTFVKPKNPTDQQSDQQQNEQAHSDGIRSILHGV
jgi:hypothetical protein